MVIKYFQQNCFFKYFDNILIKTFLIWTVFLFILVTSYYLVVPSFGIDSSSDTNLIDYFMSKNIPIASYSKIIDNPPQISILPASNSCPLLNIKNNTEYDALRVPYPLDLKGFDEKHCSLGQIYNSYGKFLYESSRQYDVSPSSIASILYVESQGNGFGPDGKMTIRFEACDFYDLWGKNHKIEFDKYFNCDKNEIENINDKFRYSSSEPFMNYHNDQDKEWKALQLARGLNDTAALNSISMGLGQIMGFNYKNIGYSSVHQMFNNLSKSIKPQLASLFSALTYHDSKPNDSCLKSLKANNYTEFANCYNKSKQDTAYGSNIKEAITIYKELTQGRLYGG
jgi:hypothetical protein